MIEYQAEGPAWSVGEDFRTRAVKLEAKDAAIFRPAVDSILIVDGHVFGRETIDGQALDLRELGVLGIHAVEFRRDWRHPGAGINRNGPSEKIRGEQDDD